MPGLAITIESDVSADKTRRTTRYDIDLFNALADFGRGVRRCHRRDAPVCEYHMENRGENIMSENCWHR
jgi:NADH-quinone oxidoreductase subunit I